MKNFIQKTKRLKDAKDTGDEIPIGFGYYIIMIFIIPHLILDIIGIGGDNMFILPYLNYFLIMLSIIFVGLISVIILHRIDTALKHDYHPYSIIKERPAKQLLFYTIGPLSLIIALIELKKYYSQQSREINTFPKKIKNKTLLTL